jgi:hypothetical protein
MKLVLSRRNLVTLLNKLDRAKAGDETARTLWKWVDGALPVRVEVVAEEDEVVYADREPGAVLPQDLTPR